MNSIRHEDSGVTCITCKRLLDLSKEDIVCCGIKHIWKNRPGLAIESIGKKDDSDKPRWSLLPLRPVKEIVRVLTFGAKKYTDNNWIKVDNPSDRYFSAMMRHIEAHMNGELLDEESHLYHLAHAGCCLLFWLHFIEKENNNIE